MQLSPGGSEEICQTIKEARIGIAVLWRGPLRHRATQSFVLLQTARLGRGIYRRRLLRAIAHQLRDEARRLAGNQRVLVDLGADIGRRRGAGFLQQLLRDRREKRGDSGNV